MTAELVLARLEDRIATLILNRPEKRNALNPEMLKALTTALTDLRNDPEVRCVVLRGTGENAFSAGFDIGRIGQDAPQPGGNFGESQDRYRSVKEAINLFPYPVIAMIYGYCVGGGLELAVACDMRVAADNARLGITPAKLGIVYGYEPIRAFVQLVGPAFARELFYTGRLVDAQRACAMGLVNCVVPTRELETYTYALAEEIAANAPRSVRAAKTMVNRILSEKPITLEEDAIFAKMRDTAADSEDLREGRQAFLEKRKPHFTGR
ncbi:MAG: enoyl-CoA hydratase/isomerase family protein [Chloroflexi bacterium]|nr:enoyl-CoA hydratase/isomerase family protein [Chloroflexota bacterium]